MCPSYQATLDEAHSTRGRANALRAAISGALPDDLGDPAVKAVLDLCLSCKACASECPSSVDVAKLKSEFLATWHDRHGVDLATRVFGNIHRLNQVAGRAPRLSNFVMSGALGKWSVGLLGIPTDRPLPKFAERRFSADRYPTHDAPDAILIVDTFTEWNHPEVGRAAHGAGAAAGPARECAAPARQASAGVRLLARACWTAPSGWRGRECAGIEPGACGGSVGDSGASCLSAFRDDVI